MNSNSWNTFLTNSHKLTKPAQAKKLISNTDIDEVKLLINHVLRGFLNKIDIHIGLKVYINNELRNDYTEKMVANPPKEHESLEDWSYKIFGNQKFGMVLIGLEEYSNSFAEKAATIVHPLLKTAGLPLNGLSFLFFMGNYGFTPFGIHKESTGEDGILFHLGPENKQFYTWDDPKYNGIKHNTEVFHDVEEMLPKGKEYNLEPGDAMFIPHYVYHIANTSKFSLSFVLDYINPPKDRLENELIKETAEEALEFKDEYATPFQLNASQYNLKEIIDFQSIQKKIEIAFYRKIIGLKSNGGIQKKSNKIHVTIPQGENVSFKGKKIFPIYLVEQDSKTIIIFARGHRIKVRNHPFLTQLIENINNGESITFVSLRQQMEPLWDLIDIFSFIQELLNTEAIVVK
ncbi:RNA methylase [Polaribacter staleyi]|uniref:RNA methylase n=1 Tax=Polaribacter staleyi TaxID=2022337 RepID=UPI0031B9F25B